jgi:CMP-N,N'-diacetyllegionaminic acid synthase
MKQPKVLGVIIARGGSKGLPRKNIRLLAGKPLIAYTIEAAQKARRLDRCVLSTEDEEIAEVARQWGADVPFMRPPELARDDTLVFPVLRHAMRWLEEHEGYVPDYVLCLQPTTPLRTAEDIDQSIEIAIEEDADAVVGYTPAKQYPHWMKRITEDGRLVEFLPMDPAYRRRQGLPPLYHVSGSIYLAKRSLLLTEDTFYTDKTYAYVVPTERHIDIDTAMDLRVAELMLSELAGVGSQRS